jgi:hypothetical protein
MIFVQEGTLPGTTATIQVAVLFTTSAGVRVVRLHTLVLAVASELAPVFRLADVDATVYWTVSFLVQFLCCFFKKQNFDRLRLPLPWRLQMV